MVEDMGDYYRVPCDNRDLVHYISAKATTRRYEGLQLHNTRHSISMKPACSRSSSARHAMLRARSTLTVIPAQRQLNETAHSRRIRLLGHQLWQIHGAHDTWVTLRRPAAAFHRRPFDDGRSSNIDAGIRTGRA